MCNSAKVTEQGLVVEINMFEIILSLMKMTVGFAINANKPNMVMYRPPCYEGLYIIERRFVMEK